MAFILFDGEKPVDEVLAATAGAGVTQADIDHLVAQGFLAEEVQQTMPMQLEEAVHSRIRQDRFDLAKPIATQLVASLGPRGFRLNLAVDEAVGYDDLLNLLPKIQEAVGPNASRPLEDALKG